MLLLGNNFLKLFHVGKGGKVGGKKLTGIQGNFPRSHEPGIAAHHAHTPRLQRTDPCRLGWQARIGADLKRQSGMMSAIVNCEIGVRI